MKNKYWIILSIVLLASALRFLGIWHGWPFSYTADEVTFVKRALAFGSWDFNPHWFHKPTFFMYLLFFEYGLYFLIGKLLGLWHSVSEFAVNYIRNPGAFYLIGRLTTTLFSIGTIVVVYKIGERFFKRGAGLIAALLLTLSYGHIVASQNVKADIPCAFFVILSIFFLLNYLKDKRISNIILSAAFAGVGAATKYYSIVMLLPIFWAVIEMSKNSIGTFYEKIRKMIFLWMAVVLIFIATYFVCAPYNLIDPLGRKLAFGIFIKLYSNLISIITGVETAQGQSDYFHSQLGYFEASIDFIRILISKTGMGIVIGSISLIGTVVLLFQSIKYRFLFLLYPFSFTIISIFLYPGYSRANHQMPIYPFIAIAGGWFVVNFAGNKGFKQKIIYAIILLFLFHTLYNIIERGLIISKKDTRNLTKEWVEENIPAGTKLLLDENLIYLQENEEALQRQIEAISKLNDIVKESPGQFTAHYSKYIKYKILAANGALTYDITDFRLPWWRESFITEGAIHLTTEYDIDMGNPFRLHGVHSYDYYVENGYQYVIIEALKLKKYEKEEDRYPSFTRFYRELFKHGFLVKEFSSTEENRRPGPPIRIYKISKNTLVSKSR